VRAKYQVAPDNQTYAFHLPEGYDPTYPLVIDPELVYSTFLGGSGNETGYGIAIDSEGNAYVAGETYSANFPTTAEGFDTNLGGTRDAFVLKVNAAGTGLVYTTFLGGGSSTDLGFGIAVDGEGSAYVVGTTQSSDFPTTVGAFDTSYNSAQDAFVVKLSTDGTELIYATFLGGSSTENGYAITVDGVGNAYVTGKTASAGSNNFPTTAGAFDTSYNGGDDVFIVKFNASGTELVYATFLGDL